MRAEMEADAQAAAEAAAMAATISGDDKNGGGGGSGAGGGGGGGGGPIVGTSALGMAAFGGNARQGGLNGSYAAQAPPLAQQQRYDGRGPPPPMAPHPSLPMQQRGYAPAQAQTGQQYNSRDGRDGRYAAPPPRHNDAYEDVSFLLYLFFLACSASMLLCFHAALCCCSLPFSTLTF